MRRFETDHRTHAFLLLLVVVVCAAYIIYQWSLGQPTVLAWIPLVLSAAGALHYFRISRR